MVVAGDKRSMLTQAASAASAPALPTSLAIESRPASTRRGRTEHEIGRSLVGLPQEIFAPTLSAIGWEAAVGLGTLGLACVTAYLA